MDANTPVSLSSFGWMMFLRIAWWQWTEPMRTFLLVAQSRRRRSRERQTQLSVKASYETVVNWGLISLKRKKSCFPKMFVTDRCCGLLRFSSNQRLQAVFYVFLLNHLNSHGRPLIQREFLIIRACVEIIVVVEAESDSVQTVTDLKSAKPCWLIYQYNAYVKPTVQRCSGVLMRTMTSRLCVVTGAKEATTFLLVHTNRFDWFIKWLAPDHLQIALV